MDPTYPLLAAVLLSLVLYSLNQRFPSPVLAIFNRWLRWIIFTLACAGLCRDLGLTERPFWMLALTFFIVWFLGETLYNWLAIKAMSESPIPLFPRYVVNQSGGEWPTHTRLLEIREWLRANKFTQVQALKAEVGGGHYLRSSVYQDPEAKLRIQVTFLPQPTGAIAVCYSLSSQTVSGRCYITDNWYIPFGGFYPENWLVERNPWRRGLAALVRGHQRRLVRANEILLPWASEPLVDINQQQHELDQVNTELGFLMPHPQREEFGKISYEGRYRVWKELWKLNYFGRASRY